MLRHFALAHVLAMTLLTHRRKAAETIDVQKFLPSVVDNPDIFMGTDWLAISLGFHFSLKRVLGNMSVVQTEMTWQNPKADTQARVIKCSNTRSVIITSECLEWCNVSLKSTGKGQSFKTSILIFTFSTFGYVININAYFIKLWTAHLSQARIVG